MQDPGTLQALCLSCGFCCDGTLFGEVTLEPADALAPLKSGGIEVQAKENELYFKQPCSAYGGGSCQVYVSRPGACQKYRCELLKKYESKRISWEETQGRISRVRSLKHTLATELARIVPEGGRMSISAVLKIVPTHAEMISDRTVLNTWAPVTMRLSALLDILHLHFRVPRRETATEDDGKEFSSDTLAAGPQ